MLGLGASGPQVIEGFHGQFYTAPVARTREATISPSGLALREGSYMGDHYQPLPQDRGTGLGKPLKLINHPVRSDIPIAIASLGPASVVATAELADVGFQPLPLKPLMRFGAIRFAKGTANVRRTEALWNLRRGQVAIGEGMGGETERDRELRCTSVAWALAEKFLQRHLFQERIRGSQNHPRFVSGGDKKAAEEAIPDDYLAKSSLIGPEGFVKERLYALRESGVTSLNVSFAGAMRQNGRPNAKTCAT